MGVNREVEILGITKEKYFAKIKNAIQKSDLSRSLRTSVLSALDQNEFYGLGVIVITVPPQKDISYVGDEAYWRNGDSTELATPKVIADITKRFI